MITTSVGVLYRILIDAPYIGVSKNRTLPFTLYKNIRIDTKIHNRLLAKRVDATFNSNISRMVLEYWIFCYQFDSQAIQ